MTDTKEELTEAAREWYSEVSEQMLIANFNWGQEQLTYFLQAGEEYPFPTDLAIVHDEMVKRGLLTLH